MKINNKKCQKTPYHRVFIKLIMRTFIFLFCSAVLALSPETGFSQDADIIIENNQVVSIKKMLRLIHQKSKYKFVYNNNLIQDAPNVTLNVGTTKVSQLLASTLNPLGLTYGFTNDDTIYLKKIIENKGKEEKNALANAVQYQVTGTVKDENGKSTTNVKGGDDDSIDPIVIH